MSVPALANDAVLSSSEEMPEGSETCSGYDFNNGVDFSRLLDSYYFTGFQATNFGLAVKEVEKMLAWRLSDETPVPEKEADFKLEPEYRANKKCTIFFGFTSNMISCGVRESIRFLCQHKMVDAIVTTGGGIEEDFMKCLADHYLGDFALPGKDLRQKGINRIGNLLVPNNNYVKFEDWFHPILDAMLSEQKEKGVVWTPSKIIDRMGKEINDERSVFHWCHQNGIPVFCPAITDGAIGDMIFFHHYKNPGFVVDIAHDVIQINSMAMDAAHSGMIIVGGGLVKHHICNANLMRNGADYAVFINTGQEFDGSDSGARPDEAVSWGKLKLDTKGCKVYAEASLVFPLLVAKTFAAQHHAKLQEGAAGAKSE